MKTFTFHNDPGHGWLQVSGDDILAAGLKPSDFSRYSYWTRSPFSGGDTYYLEEDCDAVKFLAAYRRKGFKYDTQDVFTNEDSPIRTLRRIGG